MASLIARENLVDEEAQRHQCRVDALAVGACFFDEDVLHLWRCERLAQSVLPCLGELLAQLAQVMLEAGGLA